jgi:hypothetical protein
MLGLQPTNRLCAHEKPACIDRAWRNSAIEQGLQTR